MNKWSKAFTRSRLAPTVFITRAEYRRVVLKWLDDEKIEAVTASGVYEPSITAWGLLDAGVVDMSAYGLSCLPSGLRIVGFDTLRLLCAEMELEQPRQLKGEADVPSVSDLIARHQVAKQDSELQMRHAEVLLDSYDGPALLWSIRTLLGDEALSERRGLRDPGTGEWGDLGFTQGAADLLAEKVTAHDALALLGVARPRRVNGSIIDYQDAQELAAYLAVPEETRLLWQSAGVPSLLTVAAHESGAPLDLVRAWLESDPELSPAVVAHAVRAGVAPVAVEPFLEAGVSWFMALELVQAGLKFSQLRKVLDTGLDAYHASRSLLDEMEGDK